MHLGQPSRIIAAFITLAILFCTRSHAKPPPQLITVGSPAVEAEFIASHTDGSYQFRIGEKIQKIEKHNFIRWSNPTIDLHKSLIVLTDGSRLVIAKSWTGQSSFQLDAESVTLSTKLLGKISVPRQQVHAILLHAPAESLRRTRLLDKLLSLSKDQDSLLLTNGEVLVGKLINTKAEQVAGKNRMALGFEMGGSTSYLVADRVAGLVFKKTPTPSLPHIKLAVGLSDGSYLMSAALQTSQQRYDITLSCGIQLAGANPQDIIHLQALTTPTYLSELQPLEYQHQPYLDIPWSYQTDRNLRRGRLRVAGQIYSKGIAMHSHSRLTYDIPTKANAQAGNNFSRFVADISIDDVANGRGSVIFRFLLRTNSDWHTAFTSPVIRSGDPPLPVTVELGNAKQIALIADYADRGDEQDHANWLDARFE